MVQGGCSRVAEKKRRAGVVRANKARGMTVPAGAGEIDTTRTPISVGQVKD